MLKKLPKLPFNRSFIVGSSSPTKLWLVDDVITPALLTPALKAANLEKIQELKTDGGILYGNFLAAVLSFLIISFVIFLLIKVINGMKKKEEPAPAAPAGPTQEELLAEIRDLLKNKS